MTRAKGAKGLSQQRVLTLEERYAGFVIYDKINCINPVVAEIKQDETAAAESQHNEQMVGLWNVRQIAMLGLQFQADSDSLRPKILALVNYSIHMCF